MASFRLAVLSVFVILSSGANGENTTLLLVQTLSRHGDRAPSILYPTDPNGANCWPNGLGQITQLGRKQQFDLGIFLRSLYRNFGVEDPKQIFVNSSGENRCLDSAAAQLVSFYAPREDCKFTQHLDCQPIPVHYLPPIMDKVTMAELSKLSGLDFSNPVYSYNLFVAVESEIRHNCLVPEWAYEYYDEMKHAYDNVANSYHSSPDQARLYFGPFLGLVNNNLENKISGKTDLKFVLNLAHDVQVAGVLAALNYTDTTHPPFGATLLFELHQMADASMAVRLRYINTTYPLNDEEYQPDVLILDGCTEFCPVEYFMKSYQWLIPDDWEEECQTKIQ